MIKRRWTYEERAERLSKAIDIAINIIVESKDIVDEVKVPMKKFCLEVKNLALFPEPQFKKVASIKYLENDFLTYWNEMEGNSVENFWKEIYAQGIGFERKDTLSVILKRGRIKDVHEYNILIDTIVVAEQDNRITTDQVISLNQMIGTFEDKNKGKNL